MLLCCKNFTPLFVNLHCIIVVCTKIHEICTWILWIYDHYSKWQCWRVPMLDSFGTWVNMESGGEWVSPFWLSYWFTFKPFTRGMRSSIVESHVFFRNLRICVLIIGMSINVFFFFLFSFTFTSEFSLVSLLVTSILVIAHVSSATHLVYCLIQWSIASASYH